jgi:hypothetical protein
VSQMPQEWAEYVAEARAAILNRVDTFTTRVDWIGAGADRAFADSVLEMVGYLNSRQRSLLGLPPQEPEQHVHGAWCHPAAEGCPDRPGA